MREPPAFRVEDTEGGQLVQLGGVIDELADLSFFAGLHGHVKLNLKQVSRINSYGVRAWIENVRKLPDEASLEYVECPPPIIDQMNMVAGFLGRGRVSSFFAPMACPKCDREEDRLFEAADCASQHLPPATCASCGGPLVIDDVEEQYLLFLRAQADAASPASQKSD